MVLVRDSRSACTLDRNGDHLPIARERICMIRGSGTGERQAMCHQGERPYSWMVIFPPCIGSGPARRNIPASPVCSWMDLRTCVIVGSSASMPLSESLKLVWFRCYMLQIHSRLELASPLPIRLVLVIQLVVRVVLTVAYLRY